jgi:hypothetical protein
MLALLGCLRQAQGALLAQSRKPLGIGIPEDLEQRRRHVGHAAGQIPPEPLRRAY